MQRFVHGLVVFGMLMVTTAGAQQAAEQAHEGRQAKTDKDAPGIIAVLAAENCFASGAGKTFLKVCITENGNLSWLESPAGAVHIKAREGYAVCSYDTSMTVHGFDVNSAADGWGPAIVADNKRIITRTSLDGTVQLKQTFTVIPATRSVDVKMEVKNLSPVMLPIVLLARYFDGDLDGASINQFFHNGEAVWGIKSRGVLLNPAASANLESFPVLTPYSSWDPFGAGQQFARGCQANIALSGQSGDYVGGLTFQWHNVKPGQTKSATALYRRF